jgi:hypothetical protein
MTLRLVENVSELPITNIADIPANLRLLADTIEDGADPDLRSCIFIMVRDNSLTIHVKGEDCSAYELMGLFEAAKLRVFADDIIED